MNEWNASTIKTTNPRRFSRAALAFGMTMTCLKQIDAKRPTQRRHDQYASADCWFPASTRTIPNSHLRKKVFESEQTKTRLQKCVSTSLIEHRDVDGRAMTAENTERAPSR